MSRNDPLSSFNIANHSFSILFLKPKPRFLEWLEKFATFRQIEMWRLYSPNEDFVVLIPKTDYFSGAEELDKFVNDFKPDLLQSELQRFRATEADLGYPIAAETFDMFFDCFVRHSPIVFRDLKDDKQ